jgi:hypothetical protein
MRNKPRELKIKRHLVERIVIMGMREVAGGVLSRLLFSWGLVLDIDAAMVNQVVFTFYRQPGYLFRNDTDEYWTWKGASKSEESYSYFQPSLKFDYDGNVISWVAWIILNKVLLALKAIFAFAILSLINGLLIRVAILCSNIAIFPLLSCTRSILRANMSPFQIAAIYRASPHIGAQAAFLDRRGTSKSPLILTYLFCLISFYCMYGSCYFLWSTVTFPQMIASGVNDLYFFYINMIEFVALFFLRTRSSIKYLPKCLTILNITFIFYVNSY